MGLIREINGRLPGAAHGHRAVMIDRSAPLAATACKLGVMTGGRPARKDVIDIRQAVLFFKEPGVHASRPAPGQACGPGGKSVYTGANCLCLYGGKIAMGAFCFTNSNHGADYGSGRERK
ncbi:MAG: hypothetical protein OEY50_06195 [Nitrospinota bacterium]|nr:hypothetical protein [Nitrospinota bacterium]